MIVNSLISFNISWDFLRSIDGGGLFKSNRSSYIRSLNRSAFYSHICLFYSHQRSFLLFLSCSLKASYVNTYTRERAEIQTKSQIHAICAHIFLNKQDPYAFRWVLSLLDALSLSFYIFYVSSVICKLTQGQRERTIEKADLPPKCAAVLRCVVLGYWNEAQLRVLWSWVRLSLPTQHITSINYIDHSYL